MVLHVSIAEDPGHHNRPKFEGVRAFRKTCVITYFFDDGPPADSDHTPKRVRPYVPSRVEALWKCVQGASSTVLFRSFHFHHHATKRGSGYRLGRWWYHRACNRSRRHDQLRGASRVGWTVSLARLMCSNPARIFENLSAGKGSLSPVRMPISWLSI